MKTARRALERIALLVLYVAATTGLVSGQSQSAAAYGAGDRQSLIQRMTGTWQVRQRMWTGPGAEATELPPAVAHTRLVGRTILEEEMQLAPGAHGEPFTRIAYFDYNTVDKQFEYFSIDTRAPQMMRESSCGNVAQNMAKDQGAISLCGGMFVAPKWGNASNMAFRYRLVIVPVSQSQHVIRLFLSPVSSETADEFLAFEYDYSRS